MLHALYRQIVDAVSPKAPLLARELNITCKQVDPFAELFDGCTAWDKIATMSMTKTSYDERDWLQLVDPLPNDSTSSLDFMERITIALDHIPYLEQSLESNMSIAE